MTPKQERFAREFAVGHNGAAAAGRAGYSERRAKQTASELLRRPDVAGLVRELEAETAQRLDIDAGWIAARYRDFIVGAIKGRFPASVGPKSLEGLARL